MNAVLRRPINIVLATSSLAALVGGLALVDSRVRGQVALILTGRGSSSEAGSAVLYIADSARTVLHVVHDQSMAHAPLATFAIAALVLFVFMTKT